MSATTIHNETESVAIAERGQIESRTLQLLAERSGPLPQWIRGPVSGPEYYTGFSRSKLYELASNGLIRSVSIREEGQTKGTRLFKLASILEYIEGCEARANHEVAE